MMKGGDGRDDFESLPLLMGGLKFLFDGCFKNGVIEC